MSDLPRHEDFMRPTLRVLVEHGGSATNEEIEDALIEMCQLSEQQLDITYPSTGGGIAVDRMSWARSYLKYPGFVDNPKRGVWVLTEEGRIASEWPDEEIRKAVNKGYSDRQRQLKAEKAAENNGGDPEHVEGDWSDQLLAKLKSMDPSAFERLAQRLLRESDFVKVEVSGKSGDGALMALESSE